MIINGTCWSAADRRRQALARLDEDCLDHDVEWAELQKRWPEALDRLMEDLGMFLAKHVQLRFRCESNRLTARFELAGGRTILLTLTHDGRWVYPEEL
jgi:hypothetical protein